MILRSINSRLTLTMTVMRGAAAAEEINATLLRQCAI